jgi:hypothetical protein
MIEVAVGERDADRNHVEHIDPGSDLLFVSARIDDDAFLLAAGVYIAIRLHGTYDNSLYHGILETKEFGRIVQENPMLYFLLILAIAVLFYVGIPGIGAFLARGRWRQFRATLNEVSRYPIFSAHAGWERGGFCGNFRVFGTLEAIQGEDRIWITTGSSSVAVDVRNLDVYLLPGSQADRELRAIAWDRIFSIPEGTNILVGGALFNENGRGVFRPRGRLKPLVVIHECPREQIFHRAIFGGRQRNEYWNPFTLPSLITGSFILFLFSYSLFGMQDQRALALIALAASVAPITPFLPPAFPLYFLFRRFWKKARLMRAARDVVRLPLRYFAPGSSQYPRRAVLLPNLEPYIMLMGTERDDPPRFICMGEEIEIPKEINRIDLSLPKSSPGFMAKRESFIFGVYEEEEGRIVLRKPEDPMAELILIPGNPEEIALKCGRTARFYEIASAVSVGTNVAVNLSGVIFLLALIIA